MVKYFETARSFDKHFPEGNQISNCDDVDYVPHDYWTDSTYENLDNSNESELHVAFLSFYKKVRYQMVVNT